MSLHVHVTPRERNKKYTVYVFCKYASLSTTGHRSDKLRIFKEYSWVVYLNCYFHNPKGRGANAQAWPYKSHIGKTHWFFQNLLRYSQEFIRQADFIVIITKEGSSKFVHVMAPGAGVLC